MFGSKAIPTGVLNMQLYTAGTEEVTPVALFEPEAVEELTPVALFVPEAVPADLTVPAAVPRPVPAAVFNSINDLFVPAVVPEAELPDEELALPYHLVWVGTNPS